MSTREYSKNLFSKWADEDWLNQPRFDKLFWECLNGQRSANLIGVFPLNFTRWRKIMRDGPVLATDQELKAALVRMQRRHYVFIDEGTGEGLIRSRIRRDDLDKQPNPFLSALRTMTVLDSPIFAAVLLGELSRMSLPVIDKTTPAATKLRDNLKHAWDDAHAHLEALAAGVAEPFTDPFAEDFPEGLSEPFPRPGKTPEPENPSGNPSVLGSGSVSGSLTSSSTHVGDSRARARDAQPAPQPAGDPEPPARCKAHRDLPADAEIPNCGPCANFSRSHAQWEIRERRRQRQAESDAAHAAAALKADAIAACTLCDDDGYRNGQVCNHDPAQDAANARGSAAVRAALAAKAKAEVPNA